VAVLAVGLLFSLPGLPAVPGPAQGASDATPAPSEPVAIPVLPVVHTHVLGDATHQRHAGGTWDTCRLGPAALPLADVVDAGARDRKVVALTFDDGYGGRTLRRILRVLVDRKVNATFFPVGQAVRHDPRSWKQVAAAGYPIANHTYDHRTLKKLCFGDQLAELRRANATYRRVLGIDPFPAMRPPGGEWDAATRAAATGAGDQTIVLWDVDTRDWSGVGWRRIKATALGGGKGSIVVLHTSSSSTLRALPAIIRGYRKRGFEFVTVGQLLGIPGAVPFPAEDKPEPATPDPATPDPATADPSQPAT
jgi:peptidoglycan/xylan/chitin deacetylase (PgdA/CDA1 family)